MAVSRNFPRKIYFNLKISISCLEPNQVYMQNLSQIGEPAFPQIFDLAPFLRSIALSGFVLWIKEIVGYLA